ncbi:hypothetical protein DPMN_137596 [Dreissena polymorpha]|uniref:Uncharacterized protein n=1 Tax=Dreissena polymorpha TaxID=45954 RepID=A0A9D4G623_DREPO|nr:hypothetical protein DPMN_137596 [Dreissena polymorpha]
MIEVVFVRHPDEAQGMAIHVTEEEGFRRKPAFTATEIMHQVMNLRNGNSRDGRDNSQTQTGSNIFRSYASDRGSRNGDSRDGRDGQKNSLHSYKNNTNYGQQQRHCHFNNHNTSE